MAKKPDDAPVPPVGLFDNQLVSAVRDSAQQIWLAGMGAFAKAQAEGGKMFETLVRDGAGLQRQSQAAAKETLDDLSTKAGSAAAEATAKAGASWDRLENIFEERTAKALAKLGVPTARQVAELTRRVEELTALVATLTPAAAPAKAPAKAAAKTPRAKPAAKTAAATPAPRKAAAKTTTKKAAPRKTAG
jgi:poly(hydroxyalkanoate) granule-associated protein